MKSSLLSVYTAAFCLTLFSQCVSGKDCVCELKNLARPFPMEKLNSYSTTANQCTKSITSTQLMEVDVLMLGLQRRLEQLEESVSVLENEDDGDLYGAVSLRIIELELAEVLELMGKLNKTINSHKHLSESTATELQSMTKGLQELEDFDLSHVVNKERENQRVKRELAECQHELQVTPQPPTPRPRHCPVGQLVNVTGPRTYALTQYGTSYPYGAWGKDPKPAPGKEDMYWLVALTSSNVYANYVRHYSSLSTILVGPDNFGNVILSEVIEGSPPSLGRTWRTSLHKRTATNTFMVCGVLYATRFLDKNTEEIFYSFDTETSEERYDLKIHIKKMQTNIQSLNYNPRNRMLYAYSDAYIVSYDTVFE
ncbi:hypothetical protein AMELA_G00011090 [Ameiurus melas]|uniref:Olfactomedin-like domain-containing protein n=1 Tax=Ameiurus melas TaxID=219545 RepID=A0A7J6BHF8_AMEME|nr:hypothetical protein AMELA_G00011090 [Ameiurus melas]